MGRHGVIVAAVLFSLLPSCSDDDAGAVMAITLGLDPLTAGAERARVTVNVRGSDPRVFVVGVPAGDEPVVEVRLPVKPTGQEADVAVAIFREGQAHWGVASTHLRQSRTSVVVNRWTSARSGVISGGGAAKFDVLFALDDFYDAEPAIFELTKKFPTLARGLERLADGGYPVDLHLGVLDGYTGGRLVPRSEHAPNDCARPIGSNYVEYSFAAGGKNNLPPNQDLAKTFSCMALPGSYEFRGQGLRELKAALEVPELPENLGFLRDNAVLLVVLLSVFDDCSLPPGSDLLVPGAETSAKYGYTNGFRCMRAGTLCDGQPPPNGPSNGPLAGCVAAPNPGGAGLGLLEDLTQYIALLSMPAGQGGRKSSPLDAAVVGVLPPAEPFEMVLCNPGFVFGETLVRCDTMDATSTPLCLPFPDYSCFNQTDSLFSGFPTVRYSEFVNSLLRRQVHRFCDPDYTGVFDALLDEMTASLIPGCLSFSPVDTDCLVLEGPWGSVSTVPSCDAHAPPCWRIDPNSTCRHGRLVRVNPDNTTTSDGLSLLCPR